MPDETQPNPPLVMCTWSHVCGDDKKQGAVDAKPKDELSVNVGDAGKITVTPGDDHMSIIITGDLELYREGDVALTGEPGITFNKDGVAEISGTLKLDISKNVAFELTGSRDQDTGEVKGTAGITITF
jgi:hypothetical protein